MTNGTPFLALRALLLVASLGFAACGEKALTYQCSPLCPAGSHCGAEGCIADSVVDSAVPPPPADLLSTCSPACSGATPICNSANACVACIADRDCPTGQQCKMLGTVPLCVPGCGDDSRCAAGQKCCNGACTDPGTDVNNCGACGTACVSARAGASCQAGTCVLGACATGWGDCNHDPGDGCEVNLDTTAASCGTCGAVCSLPHALTACSVSCYIAACEFGWGDCNNESGDGCELPLLDDLANCGGCGNSCPAQPHSKPACENGTCQLASCAQGYSDCDGSVTNGCEVATGTDKDNCGACGNVCGNGLVCRNSACTCQACNFPNAKSTCVNGVCALGACLPGFADCDKVAKNGCESAVSGDTNNCGACGNVCPNNQPVCIDSVCSDQMCFDIGYNGCPTGAKQWCDVIPADRNNGTQAKLACSTCFFQPGMGECVLSNGDCAGAGYTQTPNNGPAWGYQAGCSGGAGRVWAYGMSFTTYGMWAP